MAEFESNEDFENFKQDFLKLISDSVETFDSFEQNLKPHPLFCGMERYQEDYFFELAKHPENSIWNPVSAEKFVSLIEKQISYYSKCVDSPRSIRIVRAAFNAAEDADRISELKEKSEEILKSINRIRAEISKWKAGYHQ